MQLDQDKSIEILDQVKALHPEWYEAMVNSNIDIFKISNGEPVSYFKRLENLGKIRRINSPVSSTLPVNNERTFTSCLGNSSKNAKNSNMLCHYCDKNNHNMADSSVLSKFKQQKKSLALKP
jgi:hypothetical protein